MTSDPRAKRALELLREVVQERLGRHPLGHLADRGPTALEADRPRLDTRLSIPLAAGPLDDDAVEQLTEGLHAEVDALLAHRAILRPDRVFCLRCGRADCEHASTDDPRHVFDGYGPSGFPRFVDLAQWLLERQHPRLDDLYRKPPRLVTEVVSGDELEEELLDEFRDRRSDFRIHGQVVAGFFPLPDRRRTPSPTALTLQVISTVRRPGPKGRGGKQGPGGGRRLGLNLLARGADGETLEQLYARLGELPWGPVLGWSQRTLASIERAQGQRKATAEHLSRRVGGVLRSVARRLEQDRRARQRRTGHAEKRHHQGDRPTRMALSDLAQARPEAVLVDRRSDTLVVLGERGRAHVWSTAGKLVTSIRASTASIARKRRQEIWRPASAAEIAGLRRRVGVDPEPTADQGRRRGGEGGGEDRRRAGGEAS